MSVTSATRMGRRAAERNMKDICTVSRPGTKPVTDPVTGKVSRSSTPVYTGKCRLQQTLAQASTQEAGEHQFTEQGLQWQTPVGSGPFKIGDIITMTASELDSQLVGKTYRVEQLFNKSQATAQRCRVVEVL